MRQDETVTIVKRKRDAAVAAAILLPMGVIYLIPVILITIFGAEAGSELTLITLLFGIAGLGLIAGGALCLMYWFNKQLELLPNGLRYTSALGQTSTYTWDQIKVFDFNKAKGKLVLELAGKKVSFGRGYKGYDDLRQDLLNQGQLLDAKGRPKQAQRNEELTEITPLF